MTDELKLDREAFLGIEKEALMEECKHTDIRPIPGNPDFGRCEACGDPTFPLTERGAYGDDEDEEKPIPMLLTCPSCNARHIDAGAFATRPHHTHACQSCGMVWRPAIVATVGVRFLPGFKDEDT